MEPLHVGDLITTSDRHPTWSPYRVTAIYRQGDLMSISVVSADLPEHYSEGANTHYLNNYKEIDGRLISTWEPGCKEALRPPLQISIVERAAQGSLF